MAKRRKNQFNETNVYLMLVEYYKTVCGYTHHIQKTQQNAFCVPYMTMITECMDKMYDIWLEKNNERKIEMLKTVDYDLKKIDFRARLFYDYNLIGEKQWATLKMTLGNVMVQLNNWVGYCKKNNELKTE